MPIYMDVHIVPGVNARDVAQAHRADILHQDEHGCKCMTYWIDEERENVFCLIEAPSKESVEKMHTQAHGLVPNKIIEVNSTLVESFLGRIYDPAEAVITDDGLKVFSDTSFRIIVATEITDVSLVRHKLGSNKADELLQVYQAIVKKNLAAYNGREVENTGAVTISSFAAADKAVPAALTILKDSKDAGLELLGLRIGIHAGDPVANSDDLFGDTIQTAVCLAKVSSNDKVMISSPVKELLGKDITWRRHPHLSSLHPQDESVLSLLYEKLEENWHDADFTVAEFCQEMAMSKSQLYRKSIDLTGISPNLLIKDFRLEKAKALMNRQRYSISQITFDSGFTSPSYFTKCFKKKYGLLPMEYLDCLH